MSHESCVTFLGDIVRKNGKEELGTVLSLESKTTVRVLETNNCLSSICGNRLGICLTHPTL